MKKENPSGEFPIDDTNRIRGEVEALLIDDLLKRGLLLPHVHGSGSEPESDYLIWHVDIGNDREFVCNLYIRALGRPPAEEEMRARCDELAQPGGSRRYMSDEVFSSQEAKRRAKKLAPDYELLRLYELILKYYRESFRQSANASILAEGGKTLHIQNVAAIDDPALLVVVAYRDLLKRIPDYLEFRPWVDALIEGRFNKAEFLRQICDSPEAQARLSELDLTELEALPNCQRQLDPGGMGFCGVVSEALYLRHSGEASYSWRAPGNKDLPHSSSCYPHSPTLPEQSQAKNATTDVVVSTKRDISDLREKVLVEIDRRYRGTEESLFRQMEFYREYLADVKELGPMLDIGCGRGLLMKLMRDVGAKAIGIDLSAMQVDYCRTNGFDARNVEAGEFLNEQDNNSYSAVTMLHIVEHLSFDDLLRIVSDVYRVLVPGGILIIETPNPENLFISSVMFHIDPTHVRPVTFQFISTVLSVIGFEVERLPLHMPIHDDAGQSTKNIHLNNLLAASGNLSVLGRKPI